MIGKLVRVRWADANTCVGWFSIDDVKELVPSVVETVGWLQVRDKTKVIVTGSYCKEDECYGEPTVIPAQWVMQITPLVERRR